MPAYPIRIVELLRLLSTFYRGKTKQGILFRENVCIVKKTGEKQEMWLVKPPTTFVGMANQL